mgnify:CR=1 FL=1
MKDPRRIGTVPDYPLNWSTLKIIAESPAHFLAAVLAEEQKDTDTLTIGSALHCLALEPMAFPDRFAVWPTASGQRRGSVWADFKAAALASGLSIIREADVESVRAVADAIRSHSAVQTILTSSATPSVERRIEWSETDDTGVVWHFHGRPDLVLGSTLVDIKTTVSVKPARFGTQAASMYYHGQLAHYAQGLLAATGVSVSAAYLIAAEKKDPYDVAVFQVLPEDLRLGLSARAEMLSTLAACQATDTWPGRVPDIEPLRLPAWAYASDAATPEDYDGGSDLDEN